MNKGYARRSHWLLDSSLQYRMVLHLVMSVVLSVALFSTIFVLFYWGSYISGDNMFKEYVVVYKQVQTVRQVKIDGKVEQQRYYETVAQRPTTRLRLVLPIVLVNNLIIVIALALLGVFYSHRFAGPVYRIKDVISRSLAGEADRRVYLREGDELKDLAEKVNLLLERVDRTRVT